MIAKKLIEELLYCGFHISFQESQLFIDGDVENISADVLEQVKLNKNEIINFLKLNQLDSDNVSPAAVSEWYPTTPAQKRMFLLQQLNPSSKAYNISDTFFIDQQTDIVKLTETINKIINRHESLRTSFKIIDGILMQKIEENILFSLTEVTLGKEDYQDEINSAIEPFDILSFPLFRIKIFHRKYDSSILLIDMHHIISDQISFEILKNDLFQIYAGIELKPLSLQYKDFAVWLDILQKENRLDFSEIYWFNKFKDKPSPLNLPYDYSRPYNFDYKGATVNVFLSNRETLILKQVASELNVTYSTLFLAILKILLFKITSREDICIGMPVSGRNNLDLQSIVGVFINTLVIRSRPDSSLSIKDYILKIKDLVIEALENQSYPFENLIGKLFQERDLSRNPLFDIMFNYIKLDDERYVQNFSDSQNQNHYTSIAKFDLTLTVTQYENECMLSFNYCTSLFDAHTINKIIFYYRNILNALTTKIDFPLKEVDIISYEESDQLLNSFNNTEIVNTTINKSVIELFENHAVIFSNQTAIVCGDKKITYGELNARSNQLGRFLLNKGCRSGEIVGLLFDISIDTIVSMLALMKIGTVFLPLDENSPVNRVKSIIKKSSCRLILTNINQNIDFDIDVVEITDDVFVGETTNIGLGFDPSDIIYAIFTSGTSGIPKGAIIKNESLLNYIEWFKDIGAIRKEDKTALVTHFSFDLGYTALFSSIISGAELHLLKKENYLSVDYLLDYIDRWGITYLKLTPALYKIVLENDSFIKQSNSLRLVVLGGEKLSSEIVNLSFKKNEHIEIINHYGPTEATIGCIAHKINFEQLSEFNISPVIGMPINNMKAYVCDKDLNLLPLGCEGELYVSGKGLAAGYINDLELTEQKFIPNPFQTGTIMYKTGDLVKRRSNGNIEFLGRIDNQVKINGYRIELEEIKNAILRYANIKDVVVTAGNKTQSDCLFAYYVSDFDIHGNDLRNFLSLELPSYMIPNDFIHIDKIPLTLNGKIDFNKIVDVNCNKTSLLIVPTNDQELKLVYIWSEILSIESSKISIESSFFALGGNSLKVIMLIFKINEEFDIELSIKEIFMNNTIKILSALIDEKVEWETYLLYQELKGLDDSSYLDLIKEE